MAHSPTPPELILEPVGSIASLEARWRALEAVADGGFFRSWCFVSHQAARFADPYLLAITQHGQDLGLALLNRAGGRFYLNETGDAALDAVYVEHNGVLLRPGAESCLVPALAKLCGNTRVVLSGVGSAHRTAARAAGLVLESKAQAAPVVALNRLDGAYLASLSANTRAQIRRAMRLCGSDLTITRPPNLATALEWFDGMVDLHAGSWRRRGRPSAFAAPAIAAFHRKLLTEAVPARQADVLRVAAGPRLIGYLYNFVHQRRVYCYQSGFCPVADARQKPGFVSHALAVEHYRAEGMLAYDFLAGPARYKLSLAPSGGETLYWLTLYSRHSWRGCAAFAVARAAQLARAPAARLKAQLALSRGRAYGRRVSTIAVSPPDD